MQVGNSSATAAPDQPTARQRIAAAYWSGMQGRPTKTKCKNLIECSLGEPCPLYILKCVFYYTGRLKTMNGVKRLLLKYGKYTLEDLG